MILDKENPIPTIYLLDENSQFSESGYTNLSLLRVLFDEYVVYKGKWYFMTEDFYKLVDIYMEKLYIEEEYTSKDKYNLSEEAIQLVESLDRQQAKIMIFGGIT